MTYTFTIACGCRFMLIAEGAEHRPSTLKPCVAHLFLLSPFLMTIANTRVTVGLVPDDATVTP